ncbi:N-acetylglucosaminyl-phosphatidylinositol deacetylase [Leptomonas pyrrhocoris]|uniref:N-acetylglucosaminylphosphatidylinositol deacetylase n=1 Tax=Leptomonas pyrrhocoris TaxID=157538 RepID=A0A0M9FWI6_LEPPY|nr:N-acetylglucosaminyl-phosphatidylinositol deacetylase [Leptomonas pyrrhocoris]XP_015655861.1 N-acetylglucosaminyl-phosphatidylinositol deacetylase [Leptomonas pyrrhocoris]XP_015655862.1 N-acetylglucosaminyl-phosphatidylinositol deacetylase [Leptomonas pyrrhocoris]KPA77421.1 N-acetylglucosaminyl-phosphatidylinositol deacetylase [Leptomonas pyrrhocoris]KPA77422.1 N-acetylglucosaminyl-phosphatidylinositol deacetylase [Leptomonas pyrrhocoris]KPA77423.1 N-acetylglucosaminyl-phosphatidylinositol |eukprot:XP_015655860.1 N-acetylglucosaminyl-phosphatidylinositol deacetylase [Leptomonas pyrrhocoris]
MNSLLLAFLFFFTAAFVLRWTRLSNLRGAAVRGDVLVVFAHPDDEAMFFTPLLTSLRTRNVGVHFLCLSNGNVDGLGKVREKELVASGAFFGVQRRNIKVVDRSELQDGMRNAWSTTVIRKEIESYMQKAGNISTIVTFDKYGISGHPNHVAVHNGVRDLKESMPPGIIYLQLRTRNLLMKYIGPLAAFSYTTFAATYVSRTNFAALIHPASFWASMAAMQRHASQLVWFRYLFVLFSSYTYVNELEEL